ncbi:unnamed protein product [Caenorhabditis nigoni]
MSNKDPPPPPGTIGTAKKTSPTPSTVSKSAPQTDDVAKKTTKTTKTTEEMYLNGNVPYYGGYYPNGTVNRNYSNHNNSNGNRIRSTSGQRYHLPFATSSAQTTTTSGGTSSEDNPPPPPPSSNGNGFIHRHQNRTHTISDTVAMAGDDLSNVPAAVIIQLEKANRTIASQNLEIERLKSLQNEHLETGLLKKQIQEMEKEMRSSRSRFLEQQELLAEMSREMDNLLREKLKTQANFQDLEKKYKKAKFASRELAKILENDLCGTPTTSHAPFDYRSDEEESISLFEQSRNRSKLQKEQEIGEKARKVREKSDGEFLEKLIGENELLIIDLERERKIGESLQEDLEKSRALIIDKDEQLEELKLKLGKAETKATQCESDLTRTSTDLAMERLRCEALTAELHEIEGIFRNTHSTIQAYAAENEQLEDRCREAHRQIVTLNSKLEAQGIDLVTTKRTLRTLRETNEARSGPF